MGGFLTPGFNSALPQACRHLGSKSAGRYFFSLPLHLHPHCLSPFQMFKHLTKLHKLSLLRVDFNYLISHNCFLILASFATFLASDLKLPCEVKSSLFSFYNQLSIYFWPLSPNSRRQKPLPIRSFFIAAVKCWNNTNNQALLAHPEVVFP